LPAGDRWLTMKAMHFVGLDWIGGLGFAARVGLLSWFVRLVVALPVALLLAIALRAALLRYRRRALEHAHWTERARVYAPLSRLLFFFYLALAMSAMFCVSFGYEPVSALSPRVTFALTLLAFVVPLWRLRTGFEVAIGTLRRPASSLREVLGVSLVFFPALCWLPLVLFVSIPSTVLGFWVAVCASAAYLLITGFGGAALLARALGFLRPARQSVVTAVTRAATAMKRPMPQVFELVWSRPNAAALPSLGWVLFTSYGADSLSPAAMEAVAAHELCHLDESRRVRLLRGSASLAWLPTFAGSLATQIGRFKYLPVGIVATLVLTYLYTLLQRKLEREADHGAHQASDVYALALEELHRAGQIPAVMRGGTHPSLYDRMVAAGKTPDYARPKPPVWWLTLVALPVFVPLSVAAFIAAFGVAARLMPLRAELSDSAFYAVAALRGGYSGERAVAERLRSQGRARDALALWNSAGETTEPRRLSEILWLELETGDCSSAKRTVQRMEPSRRQERALERVRSFCDEQQRD
jgi:Zn-dependent protease with chaperone function